MLLGRAHEETALESALASARAGSSGVLVIRGAAGIGKTSLLRRATSVAPDLDVLEVTGIESEANLAHAALLGLLGPLLGRRRELPGPQRRALGFAFGLEEGEPPDRFLVALAALTLLTDAAAGNPILCLLDDAQWIDEETVEAMAFVARRAHADPVALLFAVREPTDACGALAGLPELPVEGLDAEAAHALLDRSVESHLDHGVAGRILTETEGNPMAILAMSAELTTAQLAGRAGLPARLPLGEGLEAKLLAQVRDLPDEAQMLLLVAAADASGDATLVGRAAGALGLSGSAARSAEAAGLISMAPRVEFRHPLIRSAVYGGATLLDRHRVHRALAAATDEGAHPDRRAWHLASAVLGADDAVASALQDSAERARARGGHTDEVRFLVRASELSSDEGHRGLRLLGAAEAAVAGGQLHQGEALLALARPLLREPVPLATADRMTGLLHLSLGRPPLAPAALLAAARDLAPHDRAQSRQALLHALDAVLISGSFTVGTTATEIALAALDGLHDGPGSEGTTDVLLRAVSTRIAHGYVASVPGLRLAAQVLCESEIPRDELLRWFGFAAFVGNELWDISAYDVALRRLATAARERGALMALQVTLLGQAALELRCGRFDSAASVYAEMLEVTTMLGNFFPFYELLDVELLAWRGDPRTRDAAADLETIASGIGSAPAVYMGSLAIAILELGQGHYRDAMEAVRRVAEADAAGWSGPALPNLIEAATRCGELDVAGEACARLGARARAAATPWGLGVLARSEALLASAEEAEPLYLDAIAHLDRTPLATEQARAHLVYGEWLRRSGRRTEARHELRTAHDAFARMGATAFAGRARTELLATGARSRSRGVDTQLDLTPQEAQIAQLASQRLTNREIAAQLFISANTVDYHLRRVFTKLAISSRRELAARLRPPSGHPRASR